MLSYEYFLRRITLLKREKEKILRRYLVDKKIIDINFLDSCFNWLNNIKSKENIIQLKINNKIINFNIYYEFEELKKDIIFLKEGERELIEYLKSKNDNFLNELNQGVKFLNKINKKNKINFITDRDGTINNYCFSYKTSIQSIYNAFFLNSALKKFQKFVILTSASLFNLKKVSILPENKFIYAGTKGREIMLNKEKIYREKIKRNIIKTLSKVYSEISELLKNKEFFVFKYIGSGFQKKYGEMTIAYNDIYKSVDKNLSDKFKNKILNIIKKYNLKYNDTGTDIEIKYDEFNKGDGIFFLNNILKNKLEEDSLLIAGDTKSDIDMIKKGKKLNNNCYAIFINKNYKSKKEIKKITETLCLSSPDILITTLYKL